MNQAQHNFNHEHITVLLSEAVEHLVLKKNGVYVDCTFGRGGHSKLILEKLNQEGRLIAIDRDKSAYEEGLKIKDTRFEIVHAHFSEIDQVLAARGISKVDGVLLDLGISSPQIDQGDRGFSFRFNAHLDMRMDQTKGITAAELLKKIEQKELEKILKEYGEEKFARRISTAIIKERDEVGSIETTKQLAKIVADHMPKKEIGQDPATRTFQALRIYVNRELEELKLMDTLMGIKRGVPGAELPPLKQRRTPRNSNLASSVIDTNRSDVASNNPIPVAPFFGSRVVKGVALADYVGMLDERALFLGQWGLKGKDFETMANEQGRPQLRSLLNDVQSKGWLNAAVVYGYFQCVSEGNDLIILHHEGPLKGDERLRFSFPRQSRDRRLCLADFFKSKASGEIDVVSFQVITMGQSISDAITELFQANLYREYLELHGLSVQLTESLTEHWHARTREELKIDGSDSKDLKEIFDQGYQGSRYSFGYPACPDLEQQVQICELLDPKRIGVELSEEFQLHPEQSTSSIVLHHPEAKYFNAS